MELGLEFRGARSSEAGFIEPALVGRLKGEKVNKGLVNGDFAAVS